MLKQIFTLLLLVTFMGVQAQDCEYKVDEKDEFTGVQIKETKFQTVVARAKMGKINHGLHLALSERDGKETLMVKYQLKQKKMKVLRFYSKKASVFFKLADGEIVQLAYAEEDFSKGSEYKSSGSGSSLSYTMTLDCKFEITAENRAKLEKSEIDKIRIVFEEDHVAEFEIKEIEKAPMIGIFTMGTRLKKTKPRAYFMEYLSCI